MRRTDFAEDDEEQQKATKQGGRLWTPQRGKNRRKRMLAKEVFVAENEGERKRRTKERRRERREKLREKWRRTTKLASEAKKEEENKEEEDGFGVGEDGRERV